MKSKEWTAREIGILKQGYCKYTINHIASLLPGRTVHSIIRMASRMDINIVRTRHILIDECLRNNPNAKYNEIADMVGCHRHTVERYIHEKSLQTV